MKHIIVLNKASFIGIKHTFEVGHTTSAAVLSLHVQIFLFLRGITSIILIRAHFQSGIFFSFEFLF